VLPGCLGCSAFSGGCFPFVGAVDFRQESCRKNRTGGCYRRIGAFYHHMSAKGVLFSMSPKKQDVGGVLPFAYLAIFEKPY
jgi:hypothetical protein